MTSRAPVALALLAACGSASCAHHLYDGPHKPASEIAVIETDGTSITGTDGRPLPDDGRIAVLPGLHQVSLRLDDPRPPQSGFAATSRSSRRSVDVCFVTRAGHRYTVRPVYTTDSWRAEVVDQNTTEFVRAELSADGSPCGRTDGSFAESARYPGLLNIPIPVRSEKK